MGDVYGSCGQETGTHHLRSLGQRNSPVQHCLFFFFSTWDRTNRVFLVSLTPPPLRRHRGSCLSHRQLDPCVSVGKPEHVRFSSQWPFSDSCPFFLLLLRLPSRRFLIWVMCFTAWRSGGLQKGTGRFTKNKFRIAVMGSLGLSSSGRATSSGFSGFFSSFPFPD